MVFFWSYFWKFLRVEKKDYLKKLDKKIRKYREWYQKFFCKIGSNINEIRQTESERVKVRVRISPIFGVRVNI